MFNNRTIISLTNWDNVESCVNAECETVFLLTGTMLTLPERVYFLQQAGKKVFVHVDLITGLNCQTVEAMTYIAEVASPDGIISTKTQAIIHAKKLGMTTVQRIFLIDGHAMKKSVETCLKNEPDAVEVMPGIMPRVIREIVGQVPFNVVAGGMFRTKEEILEALEAGATAVSGSNIELVGSKSL